MCSLSHSNSLTRVRSVQRLLGEQELDGLLCIPGVDSNYSDASWRLYCYLLCDLSGDELVQLELGPSAEEEDTFLLITPNKICVYCHPTCYSSIATRLGKWHEELTLFCDLSYPDTEDTDHFEVFKITAFIQMTEGLERIGVPLGREFSEMSVEQWPLVQAYALEEMGGLGFFTMTHKVCDVSRGMDQLFSEVDPLSVRYLQRRAARLFSKQWGDLVESVSGLEPEAVRELSEQGLLSGMKTYLQHAKLSRQSVTRAKGYAYVLIGQNSQKLKYKPCPVASNLATVGTSDGMSHHCVVELSDPLLPLAAARTFFFTQDHSPYDPDSSPLRPANTDHGYLLELYQQLVRETRSAMQFLHSVASLGELKESLKERLRTVVNKQISGRDIGIDVSVSAYSLYKVELLDTDINHKNVYYLKATLTDIHSPENPSKKLGAIVFGESFILSRLQIEPAEQEPPAPYSRCLLLSGAVPLLVAWADRESQLLAGERLKACMQTAGSRSQLGNQISIGVNDIPMSTSFVEGLVFLVKLHVLAKGLMLQNREWKFLWLPWILIENIELMESSNEEKQIRIFPKKQFTNHLPAFLQSDFSLHFSPTGADTYKLYRDTVRVLRSIEAVENLLTSQQTDYNTGSQSDTYSGVIKDISQHLEISWLYDSAISPQTLSSLANTDTRSTQNRITVHIVAGLPGSNADSLASFIIEKTQGDINWIMVRPTRCDHLFEREEFQNLFQTRIEECLAKRDSSDTEYRVMLVSPCFSPPSQVVAAVLYHPSALLRECVWIAGVTLCIGVSSSFSVNGRLHPLIMSSIRPGVVSSIILTGISPGDQTPDYTRHCTQLLSLCRSIPTGAGIIQTAHVGKLSAEDLTCILSDQLFQRLGLVRSWYNPYLYKKALSEPVVSIEHRSIKCRHHLSRGALSSALKQLPASVQYARGVVCLCADTPLCHHVEMALSHVQFYPINLSYTPPDTSSITFYGTQLEDTDLVSVVQSCLPADKQKLCSKQEQNLTTEESTEIETRCKGAPLPEGVFFNGYQYVGFDGDRWQLHPCRQEIVSLFLSELNEKIESHNREIDILYEDIFSN